MEVTFNDFTTSRNLFNYIIDKSYKKVIKVESRILDDDGVVVEKSDNFLENSKDLKFYFDDDESIEFNLLNSVAIFVRASGERKIFQIDHDMKSQELFIEHLNAELGLDLSLGSRVVHVKISGFLSGDDFAQFNSKLLELCNEYSLDCK